MKFILYLACLISIHSFAQETDSMRLKVLNSVDTENTYTFGEWTVDGGDETQLHFLGSFVAEDGIQYKIMTYRWIWGQNKTATNRILVYTVNNEYVGNYYLNDSCELPHSMSDGVLDFNYAGCDDVSACQSTVSLKKGIPQHIYLECTSMLYTFEK